MNVKAALQSLEAVRIGDCFGEAFRTSCTSDSEHRYLEQRMLPDPPWYFTDDTAMAIGIIEVLLKMGTLEGHQEELAAVFGRNYWRIGPREYTNIVAEMLKELSSCRGEDWAKMSRSAFNGTGSYGNGSAMRVAPLGAFFAMSDPHVICREAILSAQVTHFNPEGEAGAACIALAAAYVTREMLLQLNVQDPDAMIRFVLEHAPNSQTKAVVARVFEVPRRKELCKEAADLLGNGDKTTCMDTVAFVLWAAATGLQQPKVSFAEVMWMTVSVGGDRDTNCAMVAGIIANACPLSELLEWHDFSEPLMTPCWPELQKSLWPLGVPLKGKELHPCCPYTEHL